MNLEHAHLLSFLLSLFFAQVLLFCLLLEVVHKNVPDHGLPDWMTRRLW